ncbi:MAG: dockerin type I domain-containing protein [Chloroflexia bacterium]
MATRAIRTAPGHLRWLAWLAPAILILAVALVLGGTFASAGRSARDPMYGAAPHGPAPVITGTPLASPASTKASQIAADTDTDTDTPTFTSTPASATPTPSPCVASADYVVVPSMGATVVPGRDFVSGSRCDDCTVNLALPFTYSLYGRPFTNAIIGSNGTIGFVANPNGTNPTCPPAAGFDYTIFPYWINLDTQTLNCSDCGLYTSVSGLAPNRIFNIEWRARYGCCLGNNAPTLNGTANFEARLYEGTDRFDLIYGHIDQPGSYPVIGVQRDTGSRHTEYTCGTTGPHEGLQLTFRPYNCSEATFTPTFTPTPTPTGTPPTPTPPPECGPGSSYVTQQFQGVPIQPGLTDIGNSCLDCSTTLYLPFPVQLYGQTFTSVNVSSHGNMQFSSGDIAYQNSCLPNPGFSYSLMPYWDDVRTNAPGTGIFIATRGLAPNRTFVIEWRTNYTYVAGGANFEVRLYENQDKFDFIYGQIDQGSSSATIGIQKDTGSTLTQYLCDTGGLRAGTQITFRPYACGESTFTPTPTATPSPVCGPGSNYIIDQSTGASIVPGTTDVGNHCLDCTTLISLPFPVQLYGQTFSSVRASSHGNLQFASSSVAYLGCLPNPALDYTILAHWTDIRTDITGTVPSGIFTSVTGSAPNRIFNIEWRACWYGGTSCGGDVNFEVRLYEGVDKFDIVYGQLSANQGAAVGVQRATGSAYTLFTCTLPNVLSPGMQLTFRSYTCGEATYTPTPTISPTFSRTPTPACGPGANYAIQQSEGAVIVPGTFDTGNHCFDCVSVIALPFPVSFYTQTYGLVHASSHGNLQFLSADFEYQNACLPYPALGPSIMPYWDDINTASPGAGVYTSVSGIAPDRIFNIEWRTNYFGGGVSNFEVRLYENSPGGRFDIIYGQVDQSGSSATVGAEADGAGGQFIQFECNTGGLHSGLRLTFTEPLCTTPTFTPTATPTFTPTATPTVTPTPTQVLVSHLNWEGRPSQPSPRQSSPVTMTLRLASGGPAYEWPGPGITATTDNNGIFTVPLDSLALGTYNWRVKGPKFLSVSGLVTLTGSPSTSLEVGQLLVGDCNNDNVVTSLDFIILRNSFGKSPGQPGYDDRADLNGDLVVTILDFSLLKANFGISGSPPIGPTTLHPGAH